MIEKSKLLNQSVTKNELKHVGGILRKNKRKRGYKKKTLTISTPFEFRTHKRVR